MLVRNFVLSASGKCPELSGQILSPEYGIHARSRQLVDTCLANQAWDVPQEIVAQPSKLPVITISRSHSGPMSLACSPERVPVEASLKGLSLLSAITGRSIWHVACSGIPLMTPRSCQRGARGNCCHQACHVAS